MNTRSIWMSTLLVAAIVLGGAVAHSVAAQNLTIGTRSEMTLDPHQFWSTPNRAYNVQLYGSLVQLDDHLRPQPMLARSWRLADDTTWDFTLNDAARFHDGSPVTAEDVVASFDRARNLPNAAASYKGALGGIREIKSVDPQTVRFVTDRPNPALLHQVAQIAIIPATVAKSATAADFVSGRAAIGAGPYRFVRFQPGDRLVLARNDKYFGEQPKWGDVTFRTITDDAARVAALLGGDVDVIDLVPPSDIPRLRGDKGTAISMGSSDRTMYLIPDTSSERSPFIRDLDGKPLDRNPLKDLRVRQALSLAIDRDALVQRVMDGAGSPANQTVAPDVLGFDKELPPPRYDLAKAKQLLTEAGYPKGFGLAIHCTNDRYINDARLCQTLAQMLSRLGLKMEVQTLPRAVLFPKITSPEGERPALTLLAFGSGTTGDAGGVLNNTLHSYDKAKGFGAWNVGRYANPQADALIERAAIVLDPEQRGRLQAEAVGATMKDLAVIPLFHSNVVVGTRKGIAYRVYADESTLADAASPAR